MRLARHGRLLVSVLCPSSAWYDAYILLHTEHSYWLALLAAIAALGLLKNLKKHHRMQTADLEYTCFNPCLGLLEINLEAVDAHDEESVDEPL